MCAKKGCPNNLVITVFANCFYYPEYSPEWPS